MSNNDSFDNKLRKKLQDFEPQFEEKAWTKFAPQLASESRPFWVRHRKWMGYAAAAIVLAVLGIQNYRLADENSSLKTKDKGIETIVNQEDKSTSLKKDSAVIETKKSMEDDTAQSPQIATIPTFEQNKAYYPNGDKQQATQIATGNATTKKKSAQTNAKTIIVEKSSPVSPQNLAPINENKLLIPSHPEVKKEEVVKNEIEIVPENVKKGKEMTHFATISTILAKKNVDIAGDNNHSLTISPLDLLPNKMTYKPKVRPQLLLGANFITAEEKKSLGAVVGLAFTPHWSINTGLNYTAGLAKEYKDEKEYFQQTQTDFKAVIPGGISDSTKFSNIVETETQWSLPISLQYQVPIYKAISFAAALGTNIHLGGEEHIAYRYQEQHGGEEQRSDFHHRPGPPPIAKRFPIFAGAGLQAQWKGLQLQVMPLLMPSPPKMGRREDGDDLVSLQVRLTYSL